jgi:uncharacterized membrane protein YdjX (TVP38/TMEM64 family)
MPQQESMADLVRGALNDARDLVREEIALAKAEAREEVAKALRALVSFIGATLMGLIAVLFVFMALARGLSAAAGWDPWAGFAIVALLLAIAAAALGYGGYRMLTRQRHMPQTVQTFKENMAWMRGRTS